MSTDDQFLDFARVARSKVSICSASTFCLWAGLGGTGSVHFPLTKLIAQPSPQAVAIEHFLWINESLISLPPQGTPWQTMKASLLKPQVASMATSAVAPTVAPSEKIPYQEGMLVGTNRVAYLVEAGQKRGFPDIDTFSELGFLWGMIDKIGNAALSALPDGPYMNGYPDKTIRYFYKEVDGRRIWTCPRCYTLTKDPTNAPVTPPTVMPTKATPRCRWVTPHLFTCQGEHGELMWR